MKNRREATVIVALFIYNKEPTDNIHHCPDDNRRELTLDPAKRKLNCEIKVQPESFPTKDHQRTIYTSMVGNLQELFNPNEPSGALKQPTFFSKF